MKDRILQFLTANKITPSEFADKIGVQRSSMSHILNGRNQPSAAFLQKMVLTFPEMNVRWLMVGEGEMLGKLSVKTDQKELVIQMIPEAETGRTGNADELSGLFAADAGTPGTQLKQLTDSSNSLESKNNSMNLFENSVTITSKTSPEINNLSAGMEKDEQQSGNVAQNEEKKVSATVSETTPVIDQVVFFYANKTFTAYRPS